MPRCPTPAKAKFRDRIGALLSLATITRKDNTGRPSTEVRVYRCPSGQHWHLTSQKYHPHRKNGR